MEGVDKIREGLYVKKSFDGYRVVHPIKNDDGTWNWFNLFTGGSCWNWVKVILVMALIFFVTWSYMHDVKAYREITDKIFEDPIGWCSTVLDNNAYRGWVDFGGYNITQVEEMFSEVKSGVMENEA